MQLPRLGADVLTAMLPEHLLLLGIVLLKLLLVDRQFVGNITGIVSFVVVGLLLIIVGRIAPTPPRSE